MSAAFSLATQAPHVPVVLARPPCPSGWCNRGGETDGDQASEHTQGPRRLLPLWKPIFLSSGGLSTIPATRWDRALTKAALGQLRWQRWEGGYIWVGVRSFPLAFATTLQRQAPVLQRRKRQLRKADSLAQDTQLRPQLSQVASTAPESVVFPAQTCELIQAVAA